jgi:hypothetical protein
VTSKSLPVVGVISKATHAQALVTALKKAGTKPLLLGDNITPKTIPKDVRIVVLRTASCSHGASDTATSWWRSDKESRTLVWENSATRAVIELGRTNAIPINGYVAKLMGVPPTVPSDPLPSGRSPYLPTGTRMIQLVNLVAGGIESPKALTKAMIPLSRSRVGSLLRDAVTEGRLVRVGQGRYGLPGGEARPAPVPAPEPVEDAPSTPLEPLLTVEPDPAPSALSEPVEPPLRFPIIEGRIEEIVAWMNKYQIREIILDRGGDVFLSNLPEETSPPTIKFTVI